MPIGPLRPAEPSHLEGDTMRSGTTSWRARILVASGALLLAATALTPAARAAGPSDSGVSPKQVSVGYIYSADGFAGSFGANADIAFKARIDRQNAEGGVNGRKIEVEVANDHSTQNMEAAQDLVQNRKVFAVVNNSTSAVFGYRYLLDSGVATIDGGYAGTYYAEPGNENLISAFGNTSLAQGVTYDTVGKLLKKMGATKVAAVGYGISPSSKAAVENLQKYAIPAAGMKAVYTNSSADFGNVDAASIVLGIKNSGADAVFLPMVEGDNYRILQAIRENGLKMKAIILALGYGQPLLDSPIAKTFGPEVLLSSIWAPVELKSKATEQFQADLAKYYHYKGVPTAGMYDGYYQADLLILGLQAAGKNLTRQGFVDAVRGLKTYDQAGLACQPVDISAANYGKASPTSCGWYVQVKDGKFVPFPKSGQPWRGKLIAATNQPAS
jgi:branched-chain amino acid transport system substrate-binding protein